MRRYLLPTLASLVLVILTAAGCTPSPRSTPQATAPAPQVAGTATPSGLGGPAGATSNPTQPQPTSASGTSWVAYASGLASNFTKGDICSLEQPFVLEGDALPVSSGLMASFTPSSSTEGAYTFTNNILDGACVDSSDGTYVVTFYTPTEGDIIMTGLATRVCQGKTVFSQTTETRVAIRAAPGSSCP